MALIDINTWIGHWPFRQLRHNTAQALVRRMDQRAIDRAVVGQIHGVFYKNAHLSNEELASQTRRYRAAKRLALDLAGSIQEGEE